MPTYHRDDVEPSAIHPAAFVGAVDPADTPANNVGAHKLWIDTTGSTFKIKKRNGANSAWEVVASLTHADLTGLTTGDPHTQYLAKALGTVKGDILVYNGAAWIALPVSTDGFLLTADSSAASGVAWASGAAIAGGHVIEDAGLDMDQQAYLNFVGFTVADDPGNNRTTVTNPSLSNPMTTPGDLITGGAAGIPTRMAPVDDLWLHVDPVTHLLEWSALPAGGSGTVTSVDLTMPAAIFNVAGNPITTTGTLAVTMDTQTANTVLAGPTTGGAVAPAFRALVDADIPINVRRTSIVFQFGDGTNAIDSATEREQWLEFNFDGTIEGYSLTADAVGSIVIDLWKDTYANFPPAVGDTICSATKPTLAAAQKVQDTTLTGWTTAITRGNTIKAHVDSAGTIKAATLTLYVVKT